MNVQDLAKELGQKPKEFIKFLRELDIKVKSFTTKFDDATANQIRATFLGKDEKAAAEKEVTADGTIKIRSEIIAINDLARLLDVGLPDVMRVVLEKGLLLNLNSEVDFSTAKDIADKLDIKLELQENVVVDNENIRENLDKIAEEELDNNADTMETRPPIITIMGHVDHGKTRLLDTIRNTNVIDSEAGGITQHIGAYQVEINDKKITFLDTPGHAAFTSLRARGAQVTDIAILVVAADEGLKPQTIEAIHHAKAANVPIIVAINKMDKPEANIDRCKQQLSEYELIAEDWGGKTLMIPISAKNGDGVSDLLEMIILTSDMMELRASSDCLGKAVVIESRLSRKKGAIATVLVKSGVLRIGDNFVIGAATGKVRALFNDKGEKVSKALPGMPVELLGISEVPQPGHILEVLDNEKLCKSLIQERLLSNTEDAIKRINSISFEAFNQKLQDGESNKLNLIIKADVIGSVEAILNFINQIESGEIGINIVHASTGSVNENDIMLAKASQAIVISFNVPCSTSVRRLAEEEAVELRIYSIIYEILDDINKVIKGMYRPVFEEIDVAKAEVKQLFKYSKVGHIAGCYVLSGKVVRNTQARVFREDVEVFVGKISSLKRFKEDVKEVKEKFECGIVFDGSFNLAVGDTIVCFEVKEKTKK
jgi:translation initiation factor IF-2